MGLTITEIKDIEDLDKQLAQMPAVPAGHKRLYRGQNKDHDGLMIPSFYRGKDLYNAHDYSWKLAGQRIIKEEILKMPQQTVAAVNNPAANFPIDGLIQHYGLRSAGLDVTSDIHVALWFAQFKRYEEMTAEDMILAFNSKAGSFSLRKAYYGLLDSAFSYLYIFDCPVWVPGNLPKNGDSVNLDQWYGQYTSRPAKQKAWYIYADDVITPKGDLQSFVKAIFKIPKALRQQSEAQQPQDTLFYFPLPADDKIYERLLNSYFIKNDNTVFERIIDIPQYYNNHAELFELGNDDYYIKTMRITSFNNFFKTLVDTVSKNPPGLTIQLENNNWYFTAATLIKMKIPDWHLTITQSDKQGNFYIPKLEDVVVPLEGIAYNYFIELSKYELVAQNNPQKRVMRGLWIVQQDNTIGFQFFYWGTDNFTHSKTIWFNKTAATIELIEDEETMTGEYKALYQNSLVNALRVIQTYKKIIFFPRYIPFKLVYQD